MTDPAQIVEDRDTLEYLTRCGFGPLLAALEDDRCRSKSGGAGRSAGDLSISGIAEVMDISQANVKALLALLAQTRKAMER